MDPTRFFSGNPTDSAAPQGASAVPGEQAQPGAPHASSGTPAPTPPPPAAQVAPEQAGTVPPEDSHEQPVTPSAPAIDPDRYRSLEQQNQQYQQVFGQIQSWAQQQQADQQRQQIQNRFNQRTEAMKATALTMSPQDAVEYMAREQQSINQEFFSLMGQAERAMEQRIEETKRQLGTPLWVKDLVKQEGLPPDAEEDLLALGDPRLIERNLPRIKRHYQQFAALQQQLDQSARTMQAQQQVAGGAGIGGGVIAPQSVAIPADADPDTKAMLIYRDLKQRALA